MSKIKFVIILILVVLVAALGAFFYTKLHYIEKRSLTSEETPIEVAKKEKPIREEVELYFSTEDGSHLAKEVRIIEVLPGKLPEKIFEELKKGPEKKDLYKVLGDQIRLRDIYISGGVGFVDLEPSIFDQGMGTTEELLVIYSIVNSLCYSLKLSSIRFLVGGKEVDTFGHIDISGPVYPNSDIVAR